jgi:hypothetical protein
MGHSVVDSQRRPPPQPAAVPERASGGAALLGSAARPQVEQARLARWSSAMSAAARGASVSGSAPGAASDQRPSVAQPDDRVAPYPLGVSTESDTLAALSLRELRARHVDHQRTSFGTDLTNPESGHGSRAATEQLEPRGEPAVIGTTTPAALAAADQMHESSRAGATKQLHSLVESCCGRLWVSDGGAATSHGVMLDLGSWMPGCTLEVARAAGALRVTLRGVHDERRNGLERELEDLSAGLAERLGCPVVTAVESRAARR